jgi:hypothetical protein
VRLLINSVLIDNWKREIFRLWSMKVAFFWIVVGTIAALWPGLAGSIPVSWFIIGGGLFIGSFSIARFLRQPGTEQ